jgi:hypothetical protein
MQAGINSTSCSRCGTHIIRPEGKVNNSPHISSPPLPACPMGWSCMETPSAHAYARALQSWGQWLRHWCLTRDPRALRTAFTCKEIAAEKLAIWQAELALRRSVWAARAERAAREEFSLHKLLRQIRRDERVLRATQFDLAFEEMLSEISHPAGDEAAELRVLVSE